MHVGRGAIDVVNFIVFFMRICLVIVYSWHLGLFVINMNSYLVFLGTSPRLAVVTLLNAKPDAFACLCAIVCSSWTVINMGTSGRHVVHPLGREDLEYVAAANVMTCRFLKLQWSVNRFFCDKVFQTL